MDSEGLQIEQLQETIQQLKRQGQNPRLLYTIPTFQNPQVLPYLFPAPASSVVELASREDFFIIEDDPYGQSPRFNRTSLCLH